MITLKSLRKLVKNGMSALLGLPEETEQASKPLPPLIQRLNLPEMPIGLRDSFFGKRESLRARFVRDVIAMNYPNGIVSRRVVATITSHYGLNLHGHDFFRSAVKHPYWQPNIRNRRAMLIILPAAA